MRWTSDASITRSRDRQFDQAQIRLIEILNDQGYVESDPQSQAVVWERMNLPIARGLRGLIYVLSDLSQVDPSDLSTLFAGHGRIRIGFSEIDPSPLHEPSDSHVEDAVQHCWQNAYYAFSKPVGTSLICIQGDWSNVVDAKIKSGLAARATGNAAADNPYTPLYARAPHAPRPWGVTALFAEYTGNHPPLAVDWSLERKAAPLVGIHESRNQPADAGVGREIPSAASTTTADLPGIDSSTSPGPRIPSPAHRGAKAPVRELLGVRCCRQPRESRSARPGGGRPRRCRSDEEEKSESCLPRCGFAA